MILEEPFAEGHSVFHRCDARVKLLVAAAWSIVVAVSNHLPAAAIAGALSIGLVLLARLNPLRVFARLVVANAFVAFLWLVLPLSHPGTPLYELGPLAITREGVRLTALITLKCNAILLSFVALVGTSRIFDVGHALIRLRVPKSLVLVLFFCYRYLHVIHEEYHRLVDAMIVRNFRPGTNRRTYAAYASLLGALLVSSHDRAQRIYQAMLCRNFHGEFPVMTVGHLRAADVALGAALAAITAALGVFQWTAT